jgi:hypothetical protein
VLQKYTTISEHCAASIFRVKMEASCSSEMLGILPQHCVASKSRRLQVESHDSIPVLDIIF